jgi:hypothetical protein
MNEYLKFKDFKGNKVDYLITYDVFIAFWVNNIYSVDVNRKTKILYCHDFNKYGFLFNRADYEGENRGFEDSEFINNDLVVGFQTKKDCKKFIKWMKGIYKDLYSGTIQERLETRECYFYETNENERYRKCPWKHDYVNLLDFLDDYRDFLFNMGYERRFLERLKFRTKLRLKGIKIIKSEEEVEKYYDELDDEICEAREKEFEKVK